MKTHPKKQGRTTSPTNTQQHPPSRSPKRPIPTLRTTRRLIHFSYPQQTHTSNHTNMTKSVELAQRRRDAFRVRRHRSFFQHDPEHSRRYQYDVQAVRISHPYTMTIGGDVGRYGNRGNGTLLENGSQTNSNHSITGSKLSPNHHHHQSDDFGWKVVGFNGVDHGHDIDYSSFAPYGGRHRLMNHDQSGFNFNLSDALSRLERDNINSGSGLDPLSTALQLTNTNHHSSQHSQHLSSMTPIVTSNTTIDQSNSSFAPQTRRRFTTSTPKMPRLRSQSHHPSRQHHPSASNLTTTTTTISTEGVNTTQVRAYKLPETLRYVNPFPLTPIKLRRNCWFRISRDGVDVGYVEFHLFDEFSNNGCRVFRTFCRGDLPIGQHAATYKNTYIHAIHPGLWLSGGDLIGTMGRTKQGAIVGGLYDVDVLAMINYRNDRPGLLVLSSDREHFGSHFRVNYDAVPWCDGMQQVIGEVVKGWEVLKEIENTRVNAKSQPLVPIMISECGECPY